MGHIVYGNGAEYVIDDRVLAHIQLAVAAKLRRNENFLLGWQTSTDNGSGRVSLWLSPSVPLQFIFYGSRQPLLNRVWLDVLTELAFTARGMLVVSEADAEAVKEGVLTLDEVSPMIL